MSRTSIAVDYNYVHFIEDVDPWQLASVSLGRRGQNGSLIGRLNYANRFATSGTQVEADAYPSLGKRMYGYANIGYSTSDIFPDWRWGAEVFANLPRAWEASLGARQLRFDGSPVTLFTGSLGRYIGNGWVSFRPFLRSRDDGLSASASITARKYGVDQDDYVGVRVGAGSAPSDRLTPNELETRARSWSAGLHGSRYLRPRLVGTWTLGYEWEELTANTSRRRIDGAIGLRVDFPSAAR